MKLRNYPQNLQEQLLEFDTWITPSLTEIKDTDQFKSARDLTAQIIEIVGGKTDNFALSLSSAVLSDGIINYINSNPEKSPTQLIETFLSFLFLVTGKSDNNCKCQFPVFLKEKFPDHGYPEIKKNKTSLEVVKSQIPRVIKADSVASLIIKLKIDTIQQKAFFEKYINFVLSEEVYWRSLKAIGLGYYSAKLIGYELEYLLPLVVFQIRGSLSASGGHEPEKLLRIMMKEWGLIENIDFNINDHIIKKLEEEEDLKNKTKTRAYDFVLPLSHETIKEKILIQSQYYAGDSGSVSHKNIDQTRTTRTATKLILKESVTFVEFLDGAGYFSSLNGDLKKLLQMDDTYDFFQLRTAPIKLRRALQNIGLLCPLEITHAAAVLSGNVSDVKNKLLENYKQGEIDRVIKTSIEQGIIELQKDKIEITKTYNAISRRYYLLDSIAEFGSEFDQNNSLTGALLVPGFAFTFGIKMTDLTDLVIPNSGTFAHDWKDAATIFSDIQFLSDKKWIKQC